MKHLILLLLLCTFISSGFARTSVWEVSKNKNIIYLGGSLHTLRESDYPLPPAFDKAFDKSEIIVFEADLDQVGKIPMEDIISGMNYQDERTLKSVLTPEIYARLQQVLNQYEISEKEVEKMKPSMLLNMIMLIKMGQFDFAGNGVDEYYLAEAHKQKKKIEFLESVDFQLDLLLNMGEGYENEFVEYTLNDMDNVEMEINELVADWKNGSRTSLEQQMTDMEKDFPELYNDMMLKRNNNWLPLIEKYIENKQRAFIIVGLAHMYTDDGLLKLLKDKGYCVKQLK